LEASTSSWKLLAVPSSLAEIEHLDQNYLDKQNNIITYLDCLAEEFMHYFPDAILYNPVWKLVRNPFNIDVDSFPDPLKEQAVKLSNCAKNNSGTS
jgi:hypothetical protein